MAVERQADTGADRPAVGVPADVFAVDEEAAAMLERVGDAHAQRRPQPAVAVVAGELHVVGAAGAEAELQAPRVAPDHVAARELDADDLAVAVGLRVRLPGERIERAQRIVRPRRSRRLLGRRRRVGTIEQRRRRLAPVGAIERRGLERVAVGDEADEHHRLAVGRDVGIEHAVDHVGRLPDLLGRELVGVQVVDAGAIADEIEQLAVGREARLEIVGAIFGDGGDRARGHVEHIDVAPPAAPPPREGDGLAVGRPRRRVGVLHVGDGDERLDGAVAVCAQERQAARRVGGPFERDPLAVR